MSPPVLWDACKAVMRGKVIAATSFLKRQREERLKTLQAELKNLESEQKESIDPKVKMEMKRKRNQIEELYTRNSKETIIH